MIRGRKAADVARNNSSGVALEIFLVNRFRRSWRIESDHSLEVAEEGGVAMLPREFIEGVSIRLFHHAECSLENLFEVAKS